MGGVQDNRTTGDGRHARMYGSPGERARLLGLFRAAAPIIAVVGVAGYLVRAAAPVPRLGSTTVGVLFLALAAMLAVAVLLSRRRLAAFVKGARGEEWVAHELGFLPGTYTIFNGPMPGGRPLSSRSECDHVVVGPTGVFVVETKNWSGKITVRDGQILCDGRKPSRPPLDQVRAEANALRELLRRECGHDMRVRPIVCFAAGRVEGGPTGAGGVIVCGVRDLNALVSGPGNDRIEPGTQAAACGCLERLIE